MFLSCFNATLSPKLTVHKCQASFNLSSRTFHMYPDKCISIPQYSEDQRRQTALHARLCIPV